MNKPLSEVGSTSPSSVDFHGRAIRLMLDNDIPFVVGGAYALAAYTGIRRDTKDVDLFLRPSDCARALEVFAGAGYQTELTDPVWLAKARQNGEFVDLIFNGANGLSEVTDSWFEHARAGEVLGSAVLLCPPEELVLSKGFVMERDRFDGHDVAHILYICAQTIDWERLLSMYREHWRVLLGHLVLFGYVYPSERTRIPAWVMEELSKRLVEEAKQPHAEKLCRGTLVSRQQYEIDIKEWELRDVRLDLPDRSIVLLTLRH